MNEVSQSQLCLIYEPGSAAKVNGEFAEKLSYDWVSGRIYSKLLSLDLSECQFYSNSGGRSCRGISVGSCQFSPANVRGEERSRGLEAMLALSFDGATM